MDPENGPPRTLPDGTVIKSGDIGPGVQVQLAKEGGEHVVGNLIYEGYGRSLDYNDLGYMQRQNLHRFYGGVEYRTVKPWAATLETHTGIEYGERDNLDFQNQSRSLGLYEELRFKNFWRFFAYLNWRPPHYDDWEYGRRRGPPARGLLRLRALGSDGREEARLGRGVDPGWPSPTTASPWRETAASR